jgi:hypothetical protein
LLALLLAWPAVWGDDTPREGKKEPTARERYEALVKDFYTQRSEILAEVRKAAGEEQRRLIQKYSTLGRDFAEKIYKLAEDNPKGPVAADALFWVVQFGPGSPVYPKAMDRAAGLVGELPLDDLNRRLRPLRGYPALLEAVLKRAEKDGSDPQAADLLAWVATSGANLPAGRQATDRLVEKFPDNPVIERLCRELGYSGSPQAGETLKLILEKSTRPRVRSAAALALGRSLATRLDRVADNPAEADKLAAEAEKYYTMGVEQLAKDDPARQQAEVQLQTFRALRVGKEAPEIKGGDLDGKEFKLSDYRGKVVLLDFWGNW